MTAKEKTWEDQAAELGRCAMSSIREMVAALECDYDRLEELRDERDGCDEHADECGKSGNWALDNPDDAAELAELEAAAGNCKDRDDAEQRILEDPLSLQFRSGWVSSREDMEPEEFELLLSTGGPAVRIIGEINNGKPCNPQLQVQDWFKPWADYNGDSDDEAALEAYCRCFCFEV